MKKLFAVSALLCVMAMSPMRMTAHHGTGGAYDMEKPIILSGAMTEFKFVNPHVLIYFAVTDKNGKDVKVVNWLAAGPSVINWAREGWNRNSIKVGDQIQVTLFPARNGKPEGVIRKVVTTSGKEWCCETK